MFPNNISIKYFSGLDSENSIVWTKKAQMLRTNLFVLTARSNNSGLSQQQKNRRPWPPAKLATQFNLFKVGGTLGITHQVGASGQMVIIRFN